LAFFKGYEKNMVAENIAQIGILAYTIRQNIMHKQMILKVIDKSLTLVEKA
jgi:hypothetical protein